MSTVWRVEKKGSHVNYEYHILQFFTALHHIPPKREITPRFKRVQLYP